MKFKIFWEFFVEVLIFFGGLAGVVILFYLFSQNNQDSQTPKSSHANNCNREVALGLEYLSKSYQETMDIINSDGFFSLNQDKNAWSYAFELEIAYFQLIIFTHCITLYEMHSTDMMRYAIASNPSGDKNRDNQVLSNIAQSNEAIQIENLREKRRSIAKGIENKWIELILKIYGLNHNENNIAIIKNFLQERHSFYVDTLEQQRGKKKAVYNGDFYITFLEFCEKHYEFRSERGFEQNYIPIFLQMYQNFLEQASREKLGAEFIYTENNADPYLKMRAGSLKNEILTPWNSAVKYRQMIGDNLLPSSY